MSGKLLPVLGASLWILGLILFVVGLNIHTPAGSWMSIAGNIAFLVGLGLEAVWYLRRRKAARDEEEQ